MPSFKDLSPEQRRVMLAKSHETARRNRQAKAAAKKAPPKEAEPAEPAEPMQLPSPIDEDLLDGILSETEKAEIVAEARKKVREEQKKKVRKAYAEQAVLDARRAVGVVPANEEFDLTMKEKVSVFIDMPRMRKPNGGVQDPEPIIIDGTIYVTGRSYEVERGKAIYLTWLMDQNRHHVNQVNGYPRAYYEPNRMQVMWQGGTASGGSFGPGFDSLHKRPA